MRGKKKIWLQQLLILGGSILLMMVLMGFNGHKFLTDDNLNQFYPVIHSSFDTLLETKQFPLIDFYQMKGMIISDEGYYGQTNGLMFLSHLLEKLFYPHTDCINIYIVLCVALGNAAWNYVLIKLDYKQSTRLFIILMMCGVSSYFSLGYWYYVFNNYLILPMLFLACYYACYENGLYAYTSGAIILWFSLLLGNIQFTCYHYMIYAIILVLFCFESNNIQKLKILCSNIILAVVFSLPSIMLALNASKRRSVIIGDGFMNMSVSFLRQLVFSSLPVKWLEALLGNTEWWNSYVYNQSFVFPDWIEHVFTGFLFWGFIVFLIQNAWNLLRSYFKEEKKQKEDMIASEKSFFLVSVCVCAVFFELFQMGENFVVADLLHKIPVINQFRYLFKISPVLPGLFALLSAEVIEKIHHKTFYLVIILMIGLGLYNNYDICNGGEHRFYQESDKKITDEFLEIRTVRDEMAANGIDLDNYRMISIIDDSEDDFFGDVRDPKKMSFNQKTFAGIYTAGGYENALNLQGYNSLNFVFPSLFNYTNLANASLYGLDKNISYQDDYLEQFISQMQNNAIKYIVFSEKDLFVTDYIAYFEEKNILNRSIPLSNKLIVLELKNSLPICSGARMLPTENMNLVRMLPEQENEVMQIDTSFTYYDELAAYYDVNGIKKNLPVLQNESGDATIILDEDAAENEISLTYQKTGHSYVLLWGAFVSLFVLFLFTATIFGGEMIINLNCGKSGNAFHNPQ